MSDFNFDFSLDKLKSVINNDFIDQWYNAFVKILPEYEINTLLRVAQFIAQTGHESSDFKILEENLNYSASGLRKTFPKYFPNDKIANSYAKQPQKIANRVYANRMGNGPESSGDGWRYRGRGLIQLTGHDNYQNFADSIETPIEEIPEYLLTFEGATQSAAYFWITNNINKPSDLGDVTTVTKIINGSNHGLLDRLDRYVRIMKALKQ